MQQNGLRQALAKENPLQIVGTINAFTALLAQQAGFNAIYLSGAGVANASYGLPDLGITTATDVIQDVQRITYVCELPLLVDIDTGFGGVFNIERTIKQMIRAGAAGVHIEDQVAIKRCGHRPKKQLVDKDEMCDRIKAAVDANYAADFVIMARTDAAGMESMEQTLERVQAYVAAGADMVFLEGATELAQYQKIVSSISVPVLANITEFGVTPLFTRDELQQAGVQLILYPLSAFRAMNAAAAKVYNTIRKQGSQKSLIDEMQTRAQLYEVLNYLEYERKIDDLFAEGKGK